MFFFLLCFVFSQSVSDLKFVKSGAAVVDAHCFFIKQRRLSASLALIFLKRFRLSWLRHRVRVSGAEREQSCHGGLEPGLLTSVCCRRWCKQLLTYSSDPIWKWSHKVTHKYILLIWWVYEENVKKTRTTVFSVEIQIEIAEWLLKCAEEAETVLKQGEKSQNNENQN